MVSQSPASSSTVLRYPSLSEDLFLRVLMALAGGFGSLWRSCYERARSQQNGRKASKVGFVVERSDFHVKQRTFLIFCTLRSIKGCIATVWVPAFSENSSSTYTRPIVNLRDQVHTIHKTNTCTAFPRRPCQPFTQCQQTAWKAGNVAAPLTWPSETSGFQSMHP